MNKPTPFPYFGLGLVPRLREGRAQRPGRQDPHNLRTVFYPSNVLRFFPGVNDPSIKHPGRAQKKSLHSLLAPKPHLAAAACNSSTAAAVAVPGLSHHPAAAVQAALRTETEVAGGGHINQLT